MPAPDSTPPADPPGWPSQGVRTVVTFLLFLHLFAMGVAISSRATAKGGPNASIEMALRKVPGLKQYAQTLRMDLSYTYWLTRGPFPDPDVESDHWFEVDLTLPDGSQQKIVLGGAEIKLPQRYWRYQLLAREAARLSASDAMASVIPQALARRLMAETGARRGVIRVQHKQFGERPYTMDGVTVATSYTADFWIDDAGEVIFTKHEPDAEVAPPPSAGGAAKPRSGAAPPAGPRTEDG